MTDTIPPAMREIAAAVTAVTDSFCARFLDDEYAALCRRMTAQLARKRPSPLSRGEPAIWAGGVLYAVGAINFLFDRQQVPHMPAQEIAARLGISSSTTGSKAKLIQDLLKLNPYDTAYCRRAILADHPYAWFVQVDGFMMDARTLPPRLLREAQERGLVPDIPLEDVQKAVAAREAKTKGRPKGSSPGPNPVSVPREDGKHPQPSASKDQLSLDV